jgi:hypothetical protein
MPKYIIERKVPGVGLGSEAQLRAMAKKSNDALHELNGEVLWLESFVTDDSTYCVYVAPNEELVRRHAELAGFPADRISRVDTVIDPSTGEMPTTSGMTEKSKFSEQTIRQ